MTILMLANLGDAWGENTVAPAVQTSTANIAQYIRKKSNKRWYLRLAYGSI